MKGYIHVYTGNGKGKTTAAFGLSLRAAGAGKKVYIGQFVKGMHYSELDILPTIHNITLKQYGRGCFITSKPTPDDYAAALRGLSEIEEILKSGDYDVVVLDEATIALYYGLFGFDELKKALMNRAGHVEVIITGRYAPQELLDMADLVTEMKEIKHYYTKGIEARTGIEK
ncbi:MAG: cob(I)yrinic acid a,c-diamide adenosyltransferase [Deltaproteobacteria bacterium]|nr:cob(I)yrinic acid a,c-diamide adenosyltransferase [Deltaproteobacteria bacterium]